MPTIHRKQRVKTSPFHRPARLQRLPSSKEHVERDLDARSDVSDESIDHREFATKAQLQRMDAAYEKLDTYVEHTIEQLKSRVTGQISQLKEWVESRVRASEDKIAQSSETRVRNIVNGSNPPVAQGGKNGIDELKAKLALCEERFESIMAQTQIRVSSLEEHLNSGGRKGVVSEITPRPRDDMRHVKLTHEAEAKDLALHGVSEHRKNGDKKAGSPGERKGSSPHKHAHESSPHKHVHAHDVSEHMEMVVQEDSYIRVIARVRPRLRKEKQSAEGVDVLPNRQSLKLVSTRGETKSFIVDHVFDSRGADTQKVIFQQFAKDYVNFSLSGYNVCMFAYGHTGSGKTYTMLGDRGVDASGNLAGIIPRFLQDIFDAHEHQVDQVQYTCEFYEVYNELIKDLLVDGKSGDRVRKVHVHPKHGVTVENLTTNVVDTAEEALKLVEFGNQMRAVATTTMNARSSRSHAIFTFKYEKHCEGKSCQSTVTFVDLAGREDQAASENKAVQFREMCCINTSLFHLANVILKITKGIIDVHAVHDGSLADFRNSKLTLLLSPALVGNSKSALIATVAPLSKFYDDSVSTLNFASSVKKIKTRTVINNFDRKDMVRELETEIRQLQSELSVSQDGELEKEKALLAAQALIEKYRRSWEEAVAKSEEYQAQRSKTLKNMGLPDLKQFGTTLRNESNSHVPFLTKLSNDPSLQGRCNYMLDKEALSIGSDENNCDLVLHGLGILPQMCEIRCQKSQIEICLLSKDEDNAPRVLVEGYPLLASDGARKLSHGCCIFLGYSHAFRLVVPNDENISKAGSADPCVIARTVVEKLDMESAVAEIVDESGEQFKEVLPYVNNLSSHAADSTVQAFISSIRRICPLIDEANMITREIFGNDAVAFQLHALTNVFNFARDFPELVVCVLQAHEGKAKFKKCVKTVLHNLQKSKDDSPEGSPIAADTSQLLGNAQHPHAHAMGLSDHMSIDKNPLMYVWSLEKFLARLTAIRDIYNEGCEAKDDFASVRAYLAENPNASPWREAAPSEGGLEDTNVSPKGPSRALKKCNSLTSVLAAVELAKKQDPSSLVINERITAIEERLANEVPSDIAPQIVGELQERLKILEGRLVVMAEDAAPKAKEHIRLQALEEQLQCNVALERKLETVRGNVNECKSALELAVDDLAGKLSDQAVEKDMHGKITDARCVSLQKALSGLQGQLESLRIEKTNIQSDKSSVFDFFEKRMNEKIVALETKVTEISKAECQECREVTEKSISDLRCRQDSLAIGEEALSETLNKVTYSITEIEAKLEKKFVSFEEFTELRTIVEGLVANDHARVASDPHHWGQVFGGKAQASRKDSLSMLLSTQEYENRSTDVVSRQEFFDLRVRVEGGFRALLVRLEANKYVSEREDIAADQAFRGFMGVIDGKINNIHTHITKNDHLIEKLMEKAGLKVRKKRVVLLCTCGAPHDAGAKNCAVCGEEITCSKAIHERHRMKKAMVSFCDMKFQAHKSSMVSVCFDIWARGLEANCLHGYRKAHPRKIRESKSQHILVTPSSSLTPSSQLDGRVDITLSHSPTSPALGRSSANSSPTSPIEPRQAHFLTVPSSGKVVLSPGKVNYQTQRGSTLDSLPPIGE